MRTLRIWQWLSVLTASSSVAGCARFSPSPVSAANSEVPSAPQVSAGELDGRALLGNVPAQAVRLGAGAPSIVASREGIDNEWFGGFVTVPKEQCLLAYARGASSVEDIDVAIYGDDGTSLAVDEGRDVHPTVLLCPPHPNRVYVAAHVVEGEGLVILGVQLVPAEKAATVAHTLEAHGAFGQEPRPAGAWPGLDDVVRNHRAELGGHWDEVKRVAVPVDARVPTVVSMAIDQDQCVDAVVVPDDDVALLDVEAMDQNGRVVGRATEGPFTRTLTMCSPVGFAGALSVRPHVGQGLAAVVLSVAPGDVAKDLSESPNAIWTATTLPLDAAANAYDARLAKRNYAAPVSTVRGRLVLGRRLSLQLNLKPVDGTCARVDVIAGAPLSFVDAGVWSDAGRLLASGESTSSLALFVCAKGRASLELEALGRPGPFAVTTRAERWDAPAFAAHPLAASRMLSRAADGPEMMFDGKELAVRELLLRDAQAASFPETVPPGKCLRVTAGVEGDGAGVEVRALDGATEEIDRAEAAFAASVRCCAPPNQARAVRFEVRASAGLLDAVVGERVIDPPLH